MAISEPFYEGFIRKHFPAWGARRDSLRLVAAYREGVATRLSETFTAGNPLSVQSQMDRRNLAGMRTRAREAYRNNPIARGILNVETDNVVSHGMTLQAHTDSDAFNDEVEDKFARWLDTADIRGMLDGTGLQRMTWKTSRVDGDTGIVLVSKGQGSQATSKLQLLTGDLIATPDGAKSNQNILDGVETDSVGRVIRFHVIDQDERGKRKSSSIDVADFVYFPHISDAFDVRGTTCYATIFDLLNNLQQYVDGVALAAWMATVFGVIFKEPNGAKQAAGLGYTTNSAGDLSKGLTLENGMAKYIGPEGSIVQVDAKQPMQQTPDFIRMMLRLIGVPFDMPLELVLRDVSQSNLSSLRGGIQAFQRSCRAKQTVYAGPNQWGKIYRWWISREVKLGGGIGRNERFVTPVPENYWPHEWMFHGWQFTDPVTDAQAAQLEIDMGINSEENVCEMLGRDYDQLLVQRAEAKAKREAAGLQEIRSNLTRDPTPEPTEDPPAEENNNE